MSRGDGSIDAEVYSTYTHRSSVPRQVWRHLFETADREIGILVYSGLFIAEDAELLRLLANKARSGTTVRIVIGEPDSPHVNQRGQDEGINGAMAAKIHNAILLYRPLLAAGASIRLHSTVLYNSLYFGDDEMLINQHIHDIAAAYAPVLHLRRRRGRHLLDLRRQLRTRLGSGHARNSVADAGTPLGHLRHPAYILQRLDQAVHTSRQSDESSAL
ncbi:MAG TPA: hypothetical protein VGD67_23110 [Pseudonocardiaceae bacterium]